MMHSAEFMIKKRKITLFKCNEQVNFPSYQGYGYHCITKEECFKSLAYYITLHLSTTVAPK